MPHQSALPIGEEENRLRQACSRLNDEEANQDALSHAEDQAVLEVGESAADREEDDET